MSTDPAPPSVRFRFRLPPRPVLLTDLRASIVVFLVALPLCLGIAVASGAPPVAGLVTGIVGGVVVGLLPGSRLQVSGPAAGLVTLVYGLVSEHGLAVLGPVVALAGLIQLGLAAARLGRWFRAIALPVVHGMLAGIGLLIIAQQALVILGAESTGSGPGDLAALPRAVADGMSGGPQPALLAGGLALLVLLAWKRVPARFAVVPGPLVAVVVGTVAALGFGWDAERISLPGSLADVVTLPTVEGLGLLADPAVLGAAVALALVASAESLLSAVAVDRMHDGPPTRYDSELGAQGAGNTVAGLLGGLPMTAVIVRSSANVRAGATTRVSRVVHGVWLLLAVALLSGLLATIPVAVLGAVLVMAGVGLLAPREVRRVAAEGRRHLLVYGVTVVGVFTVGLLEGVLVGLALAGVVLLGQLARVTVDRDTTEDAAPDRVTVSGPATFLAVPQLAGELESVPAGTDVRVDLSAAPVVDPAAADLLHTWRDRHEKSGATVHIAGDARFAPGADR